VDLLAIEDELARLRRSPLALYRHHGARRRGSSSAAIR
jgi:hypothetical protein